jgi:hypothetical protein
MAAYRPLVLDYSGEIVMLPRTGTLDGVSAGSSTTTDIFADFNIVNGELVVTYNSIFNVSLVNGELIVGLT